MEIWQNDWHNNQTTQNVLDCDEARRSSGSFSVSLAWLTSSGEDPERKLRAANGMNAYLNTRMVENELLSVLKNTSRVGPSPSP